MDHEKCEPVFIHPEIKPRHYCHRHWGGMPHDHHDDLIVSFKQPATIRKICDFEAFTYLYVTKLIDPNNG
jgi:hypothetical protein